MTGSGNVIGGTASAPLSPNTSLVCVSFSFATAPMSPALISPTFVCDLPCASSRWPRRSCVSFVTLCTVASDFSEPESTRNSVMRPANGSATVFHTNAAAGPPSFVGMSTTSPPAFFAFSGRSTGDGTYVTIASSSGWIPTFAIEEVSTSG